MNEFTEIIKEVGCLFPFVLHTVNWDANKRNEIINTANSIKGFLCNNQIPLVATIASSLLDGRVAEIGVWYGKTTFTLVSLNPFLQVYAVDTFKGSEEHQAELQGKTYKEEFITNMKRYDIINQVNIIEDLSVNASHRFADNSLDAVFIDASHDFENVKNDILAWTPKLKSGAMIIFHDYPHPDDPNGGFEDLKKAVNIYVRDSDKFKLFGHAWGIAAAIKI